jgi:hypothetical protein
MVRMATLETVYHDFMSLTPEEQQRFRELAWADDDLDDSYWAILKPELDRRMAETRNGESGAISGEASVRRIRERIRARGG